VRDEKFAENVNAQCVTKQFVKEEPEQKVTA